ncbi:MAG: hypothetical protein NTZ33_10600 [Bacteroidetes bacterium]|nr:hypothetical protein [Bacteroidota bacterium]
MIQFLQHNEINKAKWDECIDNAVNGIAYVYSWYLDVVCSNWCALVLDDYQAVFPMAINKKMNISYIYQPFFTRYYGLYSKNEIDTVIVNQFFDAIPKQFKYIEFNIHESNVPGNTDLQLKERSYQALDINKPYEDIFNNFKYDARRTIKNAEKKLRIIENIEAENIVNLFRTNKGKQLKDIKDKDYDSLLNIIKTVNSRNCGISVGVLNEKDELISAAFFIKSNRRIIFLKGSANAEGKENGAMYLTINHIVKNNAGLADLFDFGGSSLEGIASFNHKFRPKNYVYLQVKKNNLPFIIKLISNKT